MIFGIFLSHSLDTAIRNPVQVVWRGAQKQPSSTLVSLYHDIGSNGGGHSSIRFALRDKAAAAPSSAAAHNISPMLLYMHHACNNTSFEVPKCFARNPRPACNAIPVYSYSTRTSNRYDTLLRDRLPRRPNFQKTLQARACIPWKLTSDLSISQSYSVALIINIQLAAAAVALGSMAVDIHVERESRVESTAVEGGECSPLAANSLRICCGCGVICSGSGLKNRLTNEGPAPGSARHGSTAAHQAARRHTATPLPACAYPKCSP